jgi:hypothetical protein
VYAVSRQWTIWRVMFHNVNHGGELAILLGLRGIGIPDLGDQCGHLTEQPWSGQTGREIPHRWYLKATAT